MTLAVPDLLVSTEWLAGNLTHPDLRILDCSVALVPVGSGVRPESGRGAWTREHIPGSGFADLLEDLADMTQPLPIMMPPAAQFAAAMGRYGVGQGHAVVLYDTGPHTWATRLWWMLRYSTAGCANGKPKAGRSPRHPAAIRRRTSRPCRATACSSARIMSAASTRNHAYA